MILFAVSYMRSAARWRSINMTFRLLFLALIVFGAGLGRGVAQQSDPVRIGTKAFTESVVLGELIRQSAEADGHPVQLTRQLGGTQILWSAITGGDIDVYPDYTGTLSEEIFSGRDIESQDDLRDALEEFGIRMTQPLGFNNTYAIGMKKEVAEQKSIQTISDLKDHPDLVYGFSNEFMDRSDGWPGLRRAAELSPASVRGLDHDLAYRGLEAGTIDIIDLYSTDPEIGYYDIRVLEDDIGFFPTYEAVILYRNDLDPAVVESLRRFEGMITENDMAEMNAAVKIDRQDDGAVAAAFLSKQFDFESTFVAETLYDRLLKHTADHLVLVGISLGMAIVVSIPLGILAVKVRTLEAVLLGLVGILQTIPSLALLVFMIPLFGIGTVPAIAALFLYSLLPIVRNTHAGIKNIGLPLMESARALGLPNGLVLRKIELPLAMPSILAGVKTSAVINVGTATLGALIGAGGYGQPILTGIRLDSVPLILEGAVPAALLALLVQGFFDLVEKWFER
ncbi:MAG: glycine betaine ABC transporter substrate-binding protein [Balneolaceae bacterium]